jgi:hypothetical protein
MVVGAPTVVRNTSSLLLSLLFLSLLFQLPSIERFARRGNESAHFCRQDFLTVPRAQRFYSGCDQSWVGCGGATPSS